MGDRGYDYRRKMEPERTFLARVGRVEQIGEDPYGRTSFEFDGVDVRAIGGEFANLALTDRTDPFALNRVLTTARRFRQLFELEPKVGDWLKVTIVPGERAKAWPRRLTCWEAQLTENGYTSQARGYLVAVERISRDGEPAPRALSATVAPLSSLRLAHALSTFPGAAAAGLKPARKLLRALPAPVRVRVRDVGQAGFATLEDGLGRALLHYDAGWPVSFNGRTAPKSPPRIPTAPVLLSHWDWDHLHGYYKFPRLQQVTWIAPVQHLGPGARRIAERLHAGGKLLGVSGPIATAWGLVARCGGLVGNCNQTGLSVRVMLADGEVVLMGGDADYDHIPARLRASPIDALVVTHHGAEFEGSVPTAAIPNSPAAVSYGKGNGYKHPKASALAKHATAHWSVSHTAAEGGSRRGDRTLP